MKIWSLPKNESLTTYKKYCAKEEKLLLRSNFSSFPQYFQYIPNFKSPITHILLNVVNRIIFSSILQIWYFSKYGYLEVFQRVPWNSRVECIPFLQAVFLRRLRFFTHFVTSNLIKMFVSGEKCPYSVANFALETKIIIPIKVFAVFWYCCERTLNAFRIKQSARKHAYIMLTHLNPFYIVKLGLTGVYIIFLISSKKRKRL